MLAHSTLCSRVAFGWAGRRTGWRRTRPAAVTGVRAAWLFIGAFAYGNPIATGAYILQFKPVNAVAVGAGAVYFLQGPGTITHIPQQLYQSVFNGVAVAIDHIAPNGHVLCVRNRDIHLYFTFVTAQIYIFSAGKNGATGGMVATRRTYIHSIKPFPF